MRLASVLGTPLVAVLGFGGYAVSVSAGETPPTAPVHVEGEGPFSVISGDGGFVAGAPVARRYWVSFGTDMPCMQTDPEASTDPADPDDAIVLTGVRYVDRRNPAAAVHVLLRTVTPKVVRNHPRHRDDFGLFISAWGHAGQRQRYGTHVPGRYTTDVAGYEVSDTCAQADRNATLLSKGKVPDQALTTLVFAIKSDDDGARIHHYFLDYTLNGEPRTLRVNWTMVARAPRTFQQ